MAGEVITQTSYLHKFKHSVTYSVFFRNKVARRHFCPHGHRAFPFLLPKDNCKKVTGLSSTYQSAHPKGFLNKLVHWTHRLLLRQFFFFFFDRFPLGGKKITKILYFCKGKMCLDIFLMEKEKSASDSSHWGASWAETSSPGLQSKVGCRHTELQFQHALLLHPNAISRA